MTRLDELLARLDPVGGYQGDRTAWHQALAGDDLDNISSAVDWWIEHRTRPPTVRDIRHTSRQLVNEPITRAGLAKARAALRNAGRPPTILDQGDDPT